MAIRQCLFGIWNVLWCDDPAVEVFILLLDSVDVIVNGVVLDFGITKEDLLDRILGS